MENNLCLKHCPQKPCCHKTVFPVGSERKIFQRAGVLWGDWVILNGPCPALDENGLCRLYHDSGRPPFCELLEPGDKLCQELRTKYLR